jgi:hypothetical protein
LKSTRKELILLGKAVLFLRPSRVGWDGPKGALTVATCLPSRNSHPSVVSLGIFPAPAEPGSRDIRTSRAMGRAWLLFALSTTHAAPFLGFHYPLPLSTVRDACLRATEPQNSPLAFLALYTHSSPEIEGPQVSTIPFGRSYRNVRRATEGSGYSQQDDVGDFLGRPANVG